LVGISRWSSFSFGWPSPRDPALSSRRGSIVTCDLRSTEAGMIFRFGQLAP
jgi:hypothetical protein